MALLFPRIPTRRRCVAALLFAAAAPGAARAQPAVIRIDGSTGVAPLVAALARSYVQAHPGVAIRIGEGMGTRARIEALTGGTIDIAMASHGLRVAELSRSGMRVSEIARTPVVFGVHASVSGVASLTSAWICSIYAGQTTSWQALGGPALPIVALTRPDSEVDTEVARDGIACMKELRMPDTVRVMPLAGDMAAELARTPGAIGMTTGTVVEQSGGRIRALALDGVAPDAAAVREGRYRLVREAFLVTRGDAAPPVAEFMAFVRSAEGAAVIAANGAVPVSGR